MLQLPAGLPKRLALFGLSLFFLLAGANHFLNPDFYIDMMPPYLPAHVALVYVSGVFEILGGVAVMVPSIRASAGSGLVLLLVAIFPANLHMALNPELFPGASSSALYDRLPFQALFIVPEVVHIETDKQGESGKHKSHNLCPIAHGETGATPYLHDDCYHQQHGNQGNAMVSHICAHRRKARHFGDAGNDEIETEQAASQNH